MGRRFTTRLSARHQNTAYWSIAILVAAGCVLRHIASGFALPVPWPDESAFLWQAITFQRHGILFAPELNPLREVFWMPPGYMIIIGTLFKVFGASFALARGVSLTCLIGAFLLLAGILKKQQYSFVGLILLSCVFLSIPMTAIGNTARMDAMLLFIVTACMMLLQYKQTLPALALIFITPLIHPNGLFFCLAALGYVIMTRGASETILATRKNNVIAIALLGACAICWTVYVIHIAEHWSNFLSDMAKQFQQHGDKAIPLISTGNILFVLVFGSIVFYGWKKKTVSLLLVWFGGAMWLLYGISTEAWYECFYAVSFVVLISAALPVVINLSRETFARTRPVFLRVEVTAVVVGALLFISYNSIDFYKSFTGLSINEWFGMHQERPHVLYFNASDNAAVSQYLASLPTQKRLTVQFLPEADALFFVDQETDSMKFSQGTFYPFNPDVYIIHTSRYLKGFVRHRQDSVVARIGVFPSDTLHLLSESDSTERWLGMQRVKTTP